MIQAWTGKRIAVATNHGGTVQGTLASVSDNGGLHLTGVRMQGGPVTEAWVVGGTWEFMCLVPEAGVETPRTDDWAGETTGNVKIAAIA